MLCVVTLWGSGGGNKFDAPNSVIHGHSFIAASSTTALWHSKPASASTSRSSLLLRTAMKETH